MIMDAVFMNQIALGIFLVLNLVVAYYATKGAPKTMESYALANRSLGTTTLLFSLFATLMSVSSIGLDLAYNSGVIGFLYPLSFGLMILLLGCFVFPKLVYFRREYTVSGVMKTVYGTFAGVATTLIMTAFSLLMVVGQLKEFGHMEELLDIPSQKLIAGLGLFIACYTAVGGIRSVAMTDVLQFVVFTGGLLVFGGLVIHSHGGLHAIWQFPSESAHRGFLSHPNFGSRFFSAFFWCIWPNVLISPPIVQRVLMTKNERKVRVIFFIFGITYLFFDIFTTVVGASLFFVPEELIEKPLSLKTIVLVICESVVGRLLFVLALAAIVMSTADSLLNAVGIMCVHDLLLPFFKKKHAEKGKITFTSSVTFFFGLLVTLIAIFVNRTRQDLMEYTCILVSVLSVPFVMGVLGLQGNKKGFIASFISFLLLFFLLTWLASRGYLSSLISFFSAGSYRRDLPMKNSLAIRVGWLFAIIGSTVVFFWEHYQRNGRFVFVKRDNGVWRVSRQYYPAVSFRFLTDSRSWADEKVARCGRYVVLVAFTMLFYPVFPVMFNAIDHDISEDYLFFSLVIVSGFLMGFLLGNDTWALALRPYYNLYYLLCIWFWGSLFGNYLFFECMSSSFYMAFHVIFTISLLAFLLDWSSFILFQSTGMVGALFLQRLFRGSFLPETFNVSFVILFALVSIIALLIAHQKTSMQRAFEERLKGSEKDKGRLSTTYETMRGNLRAEMREESLAMQEISQSLEDFTHREENANSIRRIQNAIMYLQSRTMIASECMPLKVEKVAIQTILDSVASYLHSEEVKVSHRVTFKNNTKLGYLFCDENLLVKVLLGGIFALITSHPDDRMVFRLEEGTIAYNFLSCKQTLPALSFVMGSREETEKTIAYPKFYTPFLREGAFSPNLLQGMRIVHAHYGSFERVSDSLLLLVVPQNIKEVRPADLFV